MKITINIPKEFEEHFNSDRFKDSLLRLCCDANCLAGNYEKETAIMLINALENAEIEFANDVGRVDDIKYFPI